MPFPSVTEQVRDHVAGLSVVTSGGYTVYADVMPSGRLAAKAIQVMQDTSEEPSRTIDATVARAKDMVRINVRGISKAKAAVQLVAATILEALKGPPISIGGINFLFVQKVSSPMAVSLLKDNEKPQYSFLAGCERWT